MKKSLSLVIGSAVGAAVGIAVTYLFGAANETAFDATYQSRWDRALEEGRVAAAEHEAMMRRQLVAATQQRTPTSTTTETP